LNTEEIISSMKLAGFTQVKSEGSSITGKRGEWQAAGAPLKRKKVDATAPVVEVSANPWASL
jgi:hypothetical protein